eukprot:scaffold2926_cov399-Prasinococcus_capsulatus_cf.AAC.8
MAEGMVARRGAPAGLDPAQPRVGSDSTAKKTPCHACRSPKPQDHHTGAAAPYLRLRVPKECAVHRAGPRFSASDQGGRGGRQQSSAAAGYRWTGTSLRRTTGGLALPFVP